MTSFASLPLSDAFLANLETLGYSTMTPIQAESLPPVLEGRDLIAQAQTGSGKTAAFGIGLLYTINPAWFATQALVMCPTRELADQVANELRRLGRSIANLKVLVLTGGSPMRPQIASLEHGAHVVVGTPGRIRDHLSRKTLDLSSIRTLVLDEADRMTDMGFYDDIAAIVKECPKRRQTLLFSATYPDDIRHATEAFLADPVEVVIEAQHTSLTIEQRFYEIGFDSRDETVARLLRHFKPASAIIFCNTKVHCRELVDTLRAQGFSALALYGELEQRERDEILVLFANRSCQILVATDVAARGLDISDLEAVINADVSKDAEVHVHRIGRTGRAGGSGLSLTLCAPNEKKWVKLIEEYQNTPAEWHELSELDEDDPGHGDPAPMMTLCISGGKKDKLRAGDVLGALTGDAKLAKEHVGKINVTEFQTYVAIDRRVAYEAFDRLSAASKLAGDFGSFKGRNFKMRFIEI
ncbi:ATP-dependent RNA helicase DbpA [Pseudoduganella sp. SL102]|uniref:ATP-dependent RNA helicase n=1 Tax=Pseudoduganella albidiflava TaxID=321983 RepID=A0A411WVB5_9BURK|nr:MULTISPECIES: ATP-dependent RNA helicase DbpA [Pseudoduganella]QBI00705.1 ATP-dependent RNA helicase DbpA [Pseudoduganella albidiflava]WBS01231.1 ATP-dependent RNA helicase DbpA [Pseudoduganella sp. SL102]GGY31232.1 ATP-dependent RNA helicase [Pseudoduganella albidiflava]